MPGNVNGEASLSENALREVLAVVTVQSNVPDSLPAPAYAYRLGRINGYIHAICDMAKMVSGERKHA